MAVSINIITQEKYEIPATNDDLLAIENFLTNNEGKKVIVVQGLGFVGAVMALVCANALNDEYAVIGVDLANENSYWKIKAINDGVFPLIADDPEIEKLFERSKKIGNFMATSDPTAYKYAKYIIVDINLDVIKDNDHDGASIKYDVNMKGFKSAIETIGSNCRDDVLILIETTVPPGTCAKVVKPIIDEKLAQRGLSTSKYRLGHSYERVMPGPHYINSIREFPRVYSGCNEDSADAIELFLTTIIDTSVCELTRLEHTNATEMAKVLENSYRATNIAFVVEWSRFAEEAGVDLYKIVNAIRARNTHANLMYPGIGVGGYCLTKDPLLASWAKMEYFGSKSDLTMSVNSVSINDKMPLFAFKRLIQVFGNMKNKKITFLGVSYRGGVGDTRFTPVEMLAKLVEDDGGSTKFHDPFVNYWQEKDCYVELDLDSVLHCNPDLVIIATGHSQYSSQMTISKLLRIEPAAIYDTIGLLSDEQLTALQSKHKVTVLGRGDLN